MDSIYKALDGLKDIRPDFISVTFGAGGSLVNQSGGGSIRKIKTDKADAKKIAKYGLDNWTELRECTPMEAIRESLKLVSRQYNLYMKNVVALQNNLISLAHKVFPGVNEMFSSPDRQAHFQEQSYH